MKRSRRVSLAGIAIALMLLAIAMAGLAAAANDPGHDTLYIEEQGSSELNGTLNITQNISIVGGKSTVQGLLLYGDGTLPSPGSPYMSAVTNDLYLDAQGNLYLKWMSGGDTVFVGATGTPTDLNVSGSLYVQGSTATVNGQAICLLDGTNCPSGLSGANVSTVNKSLGAPSSLVISPTTGDVKINLTIPTCSGTDKLTYDGSDLSCASDETGGGTNSHLHSTLNLTDLGNLTNTHMHAAANITGQLGDSQIASAATWNTKGNVNFTSGASTAGYLAQWQATGVLNNSAIYQNASGSVGIGTTTISYPLQFSFGTASVENATFGVRVVGGNVGDMAGITFQGGSNEIGGIYSTVKASYLSDMVFYTANDTNNLVERMRIDSSGLVGVGTASPAASLHVVSSSGVAFDRYSSSALGGYLLLRHSRGSEASPTAVSTGDELGKILFYGHNGSSFVSTASIYAVGNGTASGGNVPAALSFRTGNTTSDTERMRITSTGDVIITLG